MVSVFLCIAREWSGCNSSKTETLHNAYKKKHGLQKRSKVCTCVRCVPGSVREVEVLHWDVAGSRCDMVIGPVTNFEPRAEHAFANARVNMSTATDVFVRKDGMQACAQVRHGFPKLCHETALRDHTGIVHIRRYEAFHVLDSSMLYVWLLARSLL